MKNFYQPAFGKIKTFFAILFLIAFSNHISATTVTFTNNTPVSITDDAYNGSLGSMASASITVSGIPVGAVIKNIQVITSINHTWVGDLAIKLQSPDLVILGLASRPGFGESVDDGTGGSGLSDNLVAAFPIAFSDSGIYDAEVMGSVGDANNICQDDGQCSFVPSPGAIANPPLLFADMFAGTINGTWTLYAGDAGNGDTGNIDSWTIEITYEIPPANDDCANAIPIGCSLSTQVLGTTIGATADTDYSNCGAGGDNTTEQGVWYLYQGDNTRVTITTCDPDTTKTTYDTRLTVYEGSCGAFTCVTANEDMAPACAAPRQFSSSVTFNALAGTDYYVFVHGYQEDFDLSSIGNFVLNLSCDSLCVPVPGNDECASAEALTVGVTANGSTVCGNSSPTLFNPFCAPGFATLIDNWYVLTTGAATAHTITLTELTATNTGFMFYSGACGSLSEVPAFCFSPGTFPISLSPFTTYYIRVFNPSDNDAGTFDLSVNSATAPANDECSAVIPATLTNGSPQTFTGSTVDATFSSDELYYLGFPIVWEAVTLTGTCNNLTFDFCGTATGIMAQGFALYTDCPVTTTTPGIDNSTTCGDNNLTVQFTNLAAGTYYIPVLSDPLFNTLGTYTMHVSSVDCSGAIANDNCAAATPIACGTSVTGSTLTATMDGPSTNCNGDAAGPDVWYTYTGTGQDFTASLCGSTTNYDSQLDIYTGTCGALTSVACNDDSCGNQSQVGVPSSTLGATYYIRVHGFSGDAGNFELSILDNAPTITCPDTVRVSTDPGLCLASGVSLGTPVSGDDCGVPTITNDALATYPVGFPTVTWTAIDASNQTSTCTQTVIVSDNEDAVVTCPADVSVNAAAGSCSSASLNIGTATASDNCGVLTVTDDAASTIFPVGVTTVTWTATDVNTNVSTCSQTITVTDAELPTITCPSDVSVFADSGSCDATGVLLGTPVAADNCAVDTITNDESSSFAIGNTTVTWTVTDVNGNSDNCTQIVTVTDNELPVITCPADVSINADSGTCASVNVVLGTPVTSDNCGVDSVSNDALSSYPVGITNVTWVVTDVNGNIANCIQTVTVTDVELPVITCVPTISLDNTPDSCGTLSSTLVAPAATDNCGIATITNDAPSLLPIGSTTVTWTITDVNGNADICTQTVTITDVELPTITCPADTNVSVDLGSCDATGVALGTPVTADNCAIATLTNDSLSTYPTGITVVTWTVTDVNSNFATCTQNVTVTEDELPTITCPTDVFVNTDTLSCFATGVALDTPVISDNCPGVTAASDAPASFPVGNTTVTWTATDAAGNIATCTQIVTVFDLEQPVVTCNPAVSIDNSTGACSALSSSLVPPAATDNCGIDAILNDASATLPVGNTTVIWTIIDVNGNFVTCSQTVTVTDTTLPTITCPVDVSVGVDSGSCDATNVALGTPATADNCVIASLTNDSLSTYPTGTTVVTWTVTDVNGNSANCTQNVTVTENELPVITCPVDIFVDADSASCFATGVAIGTPVISDNCPGVSSASDAPASFPVGNTTVTWTATDAAGNTATCTQIVTVTDVEQPVVTCNPAVSIDNSTGACSALSSSLVAPAATDNCGIGTIINDASATLPVGTTTVIWTIIDVNGNFTTCTQTVTVNDTTLPTITCPLNVNVGVDSGSCDATNVALGTPTTADNCAVATVTNDSLTVYPSGVTTVTWTVTDVNGNAATCAQTVTVTENELPTITCPNNVSGTADSASCAATGINLGTPIALDNCPGVSTSSNAPSAFAVGNTTVVWTATDAAGNTATCTQLVSITDTELPIINCAPVSIGNDAGVCSASSSSLIIPVATDNCGIDTITNDAPATLPVGNTDVTWTVTDIHGNISSCTQTVTVTDTTLPAITCPQGVSVSVDSGSCDATNVTLGTPTTGDNCAVATTTNDSLSTYPSGVTIVTWTVTDVNGNAASCTQTVTVTEDEDPTITCPGPVTAIADSGSCAATGVTLGTAIVADNCPGVSSSNDAPSSFPVGNTTVTWTATDAAGNTATCTQIVTVTDDQDPVITCSPSVTVDNTTGICGASGLSLPAPTAVDNCTVATVTSDAATTIPLGSTTVTWTATDASGNTASCSQTIIVVDTEAPTITCPATASASTDSGTCTAAIVALGTPTTADNCSVATTTNDEPSSYSLGNTIVTWTVTDANGLSSTCSQTVTVTDNELPLITCPNVATADADAGNCTATGVILGTSSASDNCGVDTVTNDAPTAFPVGNTTVTWTVTDVNGNANSCTQIVTVSDVEDPIVTCTPTVSINNDAGVCGALSSSLVAPVSTDNCGIGPVTNDAPTTLPIGSTTVTWTVSDVNGNAVTCIQTITVTDTELPTITCPANVSVNTDSGICNATAVALGTPTTADNCTVATVTDNGLSSYPVGVTTVTWTATDVNSNAATCTQTVTVTDAELPTITCPANLSVNADAGSCGVANVTLGTPTTADNCTVDSVSSNVLSPYPVGVTTVTWTVTDASGNASTCAQTVTVTDAELPTITCPSTVTANTDAGSCTATGVVLGTATTLDNCGVDSVFNDAPSSYPVGNTTVTWTVTDVNGNVATCTQTVTISDVQLPTITCPAAVTVSANATPCVATNVTLGTATTADNCGVPVLTDNRLTSYPVGSTTVTWTATDANGNVATCSQIVTVNASVDTSVTLTGKVFTALATFATYQWYNCTTNSIISGQTSATFSPTATGNYAVIVTQNGCVDTSRCFSFTTSLGESILANGFKVYPNPAANQLTLEVTGTINGIARVQLFDLEGKVVREMSNENMSGNYTISLDDLASAVYLLRVSAESGVWNTRVMKID